MVGVPASAVIGIDLGGTKISCGLVDAEGRVSFRMTEPTPAVDGAATVIASCGRLAERVIARARDAGHSVSRIGVGVAGVIDSRSGTVVSATDSISGWTGTAIRHELHGRLGLDVSVLNDVHAHALGESWVGAGRGHATVLLVTVGTGIGGAYLSDGRVHGGANGLAGHLGHIPSPEASGLLCSCGRYGHLEAVASGPGLHSGYLRLGGDPALSNARAVADLVREHPEDDRAALGREAISRSAIALGRGLGGLINAFDPHAVIVGGGLAQAGDLWWETTLQAAADETLLPIDRYVVTLAELGQDSAIIGAARYAGMEEMSGT